MEIFSARLRWLRGLRNLSQRDMAEKLGLSQPYYGRFERNTGEPNLETLAKLPSILGERVDFLIGVTDLTKQAENIYSDFESHHSRLYILKQDFDKFQINPTDVTWSHRLFREIDNKDPEYIRKVTDALRDRINLASDTLDRIRKRLLEVISDVPLVQEKTIELINNGPGFNYILDNEY